MLFRSYYIEVLVRYLSSENEAEQELRKSVCNVLDALLEKGLVPADLKEDVTNEIGRASCRERV